MLNVCRCVRRCVLCVCCVYRCVVSVVCVCCVCKCVASVVCVWSVCGLCAVGRCAVKCKEILGAGYLGIQLFL